LCRWTFLGIFYQLGLLFTISPSAILPTSTIVCHLTKYTFIIHQVLLFDPENVK
jgi:hypothetical protein